MKIKGNVCGKREYKRKTHSIYEVKLHMNAYYYYLTYGKKGLKGISISIYLCIK